MFGQYIPLQYQIAQYLISHPRSDDDEDWEEDDYDYEEDPVDIHTYILVQVHSAGPARIHTDYRMVATSQVLLASENFKENVVGNLKQIWQSREFTDVTLVSSDGFKVQAHKTVLSSSSTFFRDMLIENQHPSVLVNMRGITQKELELLLPGVHQLW